MVVGDTIACHFANARLLFVSSAERLYKPSPARGVLKYAHSPHLRSLSTFCSETPFLTPLIWDCFGG